ncbi:MAG: thermonuclease family protein [Microbacteriaceae bacterium]
MKTVIRCLVLLAVVAIALVVASQLIRPAQSGSEQGGSSGLLPGSSETVPDAAVVTRPADAVRLRVDYVHDGDTLFVTDQVGAELKVRLLGIDTPELDSECYADEARDRLRALLPEGTEVWATHDEEPRDQYGRELLYLWSADGTFVNLNLVEQGYAEAVRIGANDAYWPALSAAEQAASTGGAGFWGAC